MSGRHDELGYLATPTSPPRGGIVVVHDVWGLYDHFRAIADRLAQAGYAALAVSLYRREPGLRVQEPGAFMRSLDDRRVIADVAEACAALRALPDLAGKRVGVIGFCMGGMYALLAGAQLPDLAAVVPFYGILSHSHGLLHAEGGLDPDKKPIQPIKAAASMRCPLLAFFGDQDVFVSAEDVAALRNALISAGVPHEVRVFEGVGHAFMNDTRPAAYKPNEARQAWEEMLRFIARHVG